MTAALFRLDGKTALVTGASSGLGAHFAQILSDAGAHVVLAARRMERIEAMAQDLNASGGKAMAVSLDVTKTDSVEAAFAEADSKLGPISIVVNNAGVARPKKFVELSEDDWDFVMDVNLKGAWRVSQKAAQQMLAQNVSGSIINIASILALGVGPTHSAYATSKAALAHMTKSMATELFKHGIRVNALCPGYVLTEMNEDFFATEAGQAYLQQTPPKRLGTSDELTGPLLLLASDASTFMTGVLMPVDGGHSIRLT